MDQIRVVSMAVHNKSRVANFSEVRKSCHGKPCCVFPVDPVVHCRAYILMPESITKYTGKDLAFITCASLIAWDKTGNASQEMVAETGF